MLLFLLYNYTTPHPTPLAFFCILSHRRKPALSDYFVWNMYHTLYLSHSRITSLPKNLIHVEPESGFLKPCAGASSLNQCPSITSPNYNARFLPAAPARRPIWGLTHFCLHYQTQLGLQILRLNAGPQALPLFTPGSEWRIHRGGCQG